MIFSLYSPISGQVNKGVGGWEEGRVGVGREVAKTLETIWREIWRHRWAQSHHQAKEPSFWSWEQFLVDRVQLVRSSGTNVLVMGLQCHKFTLQKSRPLQLCHRRCGVWVALEYHYTLDQLFSARALILKAITPCAEKRVWPRETRNLVRLDRNHWNQSLKSWNQHHAEIRNHSTAE